ncbi:MAG: roadblock/LC7 domain-containing protein [Candidatus Lokiarchaeota archaeon]|jgi:predicted regulator of Ras-like GTPase activity (Roadblock/LC7/MglB family)|nr:roadblock/LC7 domain-containing protein [Candidatus Lokiarchaeota archaeon]
MIESPKIDDITRELDKLELVNGIIGTAIVNRNGLTIISRLPRDIDNRKFGAMAATMFEAMETATSTLKDKVLNLTVEFDDYQLVVYVLNAEIIFVSLLELNIDLGLVLIEIEECTKIIHKFLEV